MKTLDNFATNRLQARKIQFDDFELLHQMHQNPKVMATLGGLRSTEETQKYLLDNIQHWQRNGFGLWLLFNKISQEFVGRGGLRKVKISGNEEIEVAYAIMPEHWNQGLATEIANACIQIAFEQLHLEKLICFTLPTNTSSLRVMEKVGLYYDRNFVYADFPHALYRLSNLDYWQQRIVL